LNQFDLKYNKIASAMLTVTPLLHKVASEKKYTFISTGMSTDKEIDNAVGIFREYDCPFELMHCTSAYPTEDYEVNLNGIKTLREKYNCNVGYSGHERAVAISIAAVVLGATSIERHITLDRTMYGSDQAASLEPQGFQALIKGIRKIEIALGDGEIGFILESEKPARQNLATPYWYKKMIDPEN
jgi:N-acetylneuraminate synthase